MADLLIQMGGVRTEDRSILIRSRHATAASHISTLHSQLNSRVECFESIRAEFTKLLESIREGFFLARTASRTYPAEAGDRFRQSIFECSPAFTCLASLSE